MTNVKKKKKAHISHYNPPYSFPQRTHLQFVIKTHQPRPATHLSRLWISTSTSWVTSSSSRERPRGTTVMSWIYIYRFISKKGKSILPNASSHTRWQFLTYRPVLERPKTRKLQEGNDKTCGSPLRRYVEDPDTLERSEWCVRSPLLPVSSKLHPFRPRDTRRGWPF